MTSQPSQSVDWEARYHRLADACVETRERAAEMSEMRLSAFQRETLMNVMGAINHALEDPDGERIEH
jgi:hypothetical protein